MANVQTKKLKALQEHWKSYRCAHQGDKALRKRTIKDGSIQYVFQCLTCGNATSAPIAKSKACEMNGNVEPPPFDDDLIKNWKQACEEGTRKITGQFDDLEEFKRNEFQKWYDDYLDSDVWKGKKEKVLTRCNGMCEGCMNADAEVVHHLTYRNVGNEFLFELVGLCHACHKRYHENDNEI